MLILSIEVLPKQTESLRSRLRACEAGGKHKAWGASPRIDNKNSTEPAKRATAHGHKDCHPFHGLCAYSFYRSWGLRPRLYASACFAG